MAQSLTSSYPYREHGSKVIGEVTLDQVYGGARGVKALVWEVGASGRCTADVLGIC